jgi:hypothetical protein
MDGITKLTNPRLLNVYLGPYLSKVDPGSHLLSADLEFFFTYPNLRVKYEYRYEYEYE